MKEVIVASRSPRGAAHVRSLLAGGQVLVCGTPHEVAQCPESYTGQFLKQMGL